MEPVVYGMNRVDAFLEYVIRKGKNVVYELKYIDSEGRVRLASFDEEDKLVKMSIEENIKEKREF